MPELPHESGNPVFSIFYTDAIYYGADLQDYFEREFTPWHGRPSPKPLKYIPFWSNLVQRFAEKRNCPA